MNLESYKKIYWEIEEEILKIKKDISHIFFVLGFGGISIPLSLYIANYSNFWAIINCLLMTDLTYESLKTLTFLWDKLKSLQDDKEVIFLETEIHEYLQEQEQKLINDVIELFDDAKITSLEEIEAAYTFLVKGGYLSFAHHWHYENKIDIHYTHLITTLIRGAGCCRNIVDLLTNIEKNLNFDASKTYMSLENETEDEPYLFSTIDFSDFLQELNMDTSKVPYLKESKQEKESLKKPLLGIVLAKAKKIPNHVIVTTKQKDVVTHFDPTNHIYLRTGTGNAVRYYNEEKNMKVFNPNFSQRYGNSFNPSQKQLYDTFNSFYQKCFYDYEKLFQRFYKAHQDTYWQIKKSSDEILLTRSKK